MHRIWAAICRRGAAIIGGAFIALMLLPAAAFAEVAELRDPNDFPSGINAPSPPPSGPGGSDGSVPEIFLGICVLAAILFVISRLADR
jgi:hypothetical protein